MYICGDMSSLEDLASSTIWVPGIETFRFGSKHIYSLIHLAVPNFSFLYIKSQKTVIAVLITFMYKYLEIINFSFVKYFILYFLM